MLFISRPDSTYCSFYFSNAMNAHLCHMGRWIKCKVLTIFVLELFVAVPVIDIPFQLVKHLANPEFPCSCTIFSSVDFNCFKLLSHTCTHTHMHTPTHTPTHTHPHTHTQPSQLHGGSRLSLLDGSGMSQRQGLLRASRRLLLWHYTGRDHGSDPS